MDLIKRHGGDSLSYMIQVCIPPYFEWVCVEVGTKALQEIKRQVTHIKSIYPDYLVRAFDVMSAKTLVVA